MGLNLNFLGRNPLFGTRRFLIALLTMGGGRGPWWDIGGANGGPYVDFGGSGSLPGNSLVRKLDRKVINMNCEKIKKINQIN